MSLALPADLLCAALSVSAAEVCEPSLATPHLLRVLEHGVAETHLHLTAGRSFSDFWQTRMADAVKDAPKGDAERRIVLQAALARVLLGRYLHGRRIESHVLSFDDWLRGSASPYSLCALLLARLRQQTARDLHVRVLAHVRALMKPQSSPLCLAELDFVYGRLVGTSGEDPLSAADSPSGERNPEHALLVEGLHCVAPGRDLIFSGLFWQYVRLRCRVFRRLTQRPGTEGLDWFRRHFEAIDQFGKPPFTQRVQGAIRNAQRGTMLNALEIRVGPSDDWVDMRSRLLELMDAIEPVNPTRPARPLEIGLVVHVIKSATTPHSPANPRNGGVRYGAWARAAQQQAAVLGHFVRRFPKALTFVRGVDAANAELELPNWVVLPFLHLAHQPIAGSTSGLHGLQLTCHVGEEFRSLHEGLRRIDEVVTYAGMQPGDRLGHCVALGVDAARWADTHREVWMPREERLWDLVWEYELAIRPGGIGGGSTRPLQAGHQAERLAHALWDRTISITELCRVRAVLHDPRWLARVGYPRTMRGASVRHDSVEGLAYGLLTDAALFARGQQKYERVHWQPEDVAFLQDAATLLRQQLSCREVTIETNPSSNLLIANLPGFDAHPAHAFGPVRVSVNTDDPTTFATKLADEYAYLFASLLDGGRSHDDALKWIDRAREHGLSSRFTVPESATRVAREGLRSALFGRSGSG